MKSFSAYGIMATVSLIIRQFFLPNPFAYLGVQGIIVNWIVGFIIHPIAFGIVGLRYIKGSDPAWGSFLYLVVYSAITGILYVMGLFAFAWWWVLCVIIMCITVPFLLKWILVLLEDMFDWLFDKIVGLFTKKNKNDNKEEDENAKS